VPGEAITGPTQRWFAIVEASGRKPSHDFSFRIEAATPQVCTALALEAREFVVVRGSIRYVDGVPWLQETSYYARNSRRCAGPQSRPGRPKLSRGSVSSE